MHAEHKHLTLLPRIMELQHALFFSFSDALLKLPTSVVTALHVDEVDQVWFIIHRPPQHVSEFDRKFPARLEFYRKGKDFHMHVSGHATLVTDPEEINNAFHLSSDIRSQAMTSMILVKMKINKLEFFPHKEQEPEVQVQNTQPSAFFKSLQYIVKDIIPVFQSH